MHPNQLAACMPVSGWSAIKWMWMSDAKSSGFDANTHLLPGDQKFRSESKKPA
jgi:hypothetical protein